MKEILQAMNHFIGETMVLPAGNWNKELLMPVLRKQKRLRQEQGFDDTDSDMDSDEYEEGLKSKLALCYKLFYSGWVNLLAEALFQHLPFMSVLGVPMVHVVPL